MQDIHGISGGGGGGGGRFLGGDRRLRPHNHQALKCPRCDSLSTKFCYYNNYNLSQPRHFCKSCHRYWTKGGVLRNVPIGGGCRKSKRSKPKTDAVSEDKSNRSSSSESSSLTAATTVAAQTGGESAGPVDESMAPGNTTSKSTVVYKFPDSGSFFNVNPPSSDHHSSTDGQIFASEMGSFTNLMTSSEEMMGFDICDVQTTSYRCSGSGLVGTTGVADEFKLQNMRGVSDVGLAALDWGGGGGDQGIFDLTAAVDPAYWSQTQWTDNDQSLNYLP